MVSLHGLRKRCKLRLSFHPFDYMRSSTPRLEILPQHISLGMRSRWGWEGSLPQALSFVARSARVFSLIVAVIAIALCAAMACAQAPHPKFRAIAIAEKGGLHQQFVDAARIWLAHEAVEDGFSIDYIENTDKIDEAFLSQYQLFIQLNYPPYAWKANAMLAFEKYIEEGKGG